VQLIEPYLRPNGVLVSLQNSLNDEITSLTKRIEQGSLRPASDNLAHLEKLI